MQANRHLQRKAPRKTRGFAWARIVDAELGVVTYRLSRSDEQRVLHTDMRTFRIDTHRSDIARAVWAMRIRLRDKVDEIVLRQLGVTA